MGTATLPNNKKGQDSEYDPIQADYDARFNAIAAANPVADDLKKRENAAGSLNAESASAGPDNPIADAREKEEQGGGGYVNNYTRNRQEESRNKKVGLKDWKKLSPIASIGALFGGGGILLGIFFTPVLGFMDAKEAVFDSLNDQLEAMEIQTDKLLQTKLKSMEATLGVCTNTVNIRCKFATMDPKKEVRRFTEAGFQIESEPKKFGNNVKVKAIITPDNVRITNPNELRAYSRTNLGRINLIPALNIRLAGFADSKARFVFGKFRTHKGAKLPKNATPENIAKAMEDSLSGLNGGGDFKPYQVEKDANGKERRYIVAPDNTKVYEDANPGRYNELVAAVDVKYEALKAQIDASSLEKNATSAFLEGLGKGLSATGSLDTACSVYNGARAVSAMAKVLRQTVLVQYFLLIASEGSDRVKAGDGDAAILSYLGNLAMSADTNKTVIDETSIVGTNSDGSPKFKEVPNIFYGATMFDAPWLRTLEYGDITKPNARMQQYMVGGGLVGTLDVVMKTIEDILGGRQGIKKTCGTIQSWWVRGAGLIAGVFLAAGSFGASTVVSIGASMAIGFAMPFIQASMADMVKGTSVSPKTRGVDMGLGFVSGGGALMGTMASARGMRAGNMEQIREYSFATAENRKERIAAEIYKAKSTPFDIANQYSFLGSFARKLNPTILKSQATVSGALTALPGLFATAAQSIVPQANAQQVFNPERFKQCENDIGYADIGIDADVACNVRFIMTPRQLNMDPDETAVWMQQNGHIEEDGAAKSDVYKEWLEKCTEQRQAGWGETVNDDQVNDFDTGKACVQHPDMDMIERFGAFYGFFGANNALGEDFSSQGESTSNENGQVVSPVGGTMVTTSGYGPRGSVGGAPGATSWHAAIDMVSNNTDVFAAMAGEVVTIQGSGVNVVAIKHADGLVTRYLHMEPKDVTVKVGDKVTAGQKIGKIGCAGRDQGFCSGDHLDFNVWIDGVTDKTKYAKYKTAPPQAGNSAGKAINPANFLTDNGVKGYEKEVNDL